MEAFQEVPQVAPQVQPSMEGACRLVAPLVVLRDLQLQVVPLRLQGVPRVAFLQAQVLQLPLQVDLPLAPLVDLQVAHQANLQYHYLALLALPKEVKWNH